MVCEACKANIFTNFGDQRWCYLCKKNGFMYISTYVSYWHMPGCACVGMCSIYIY